MLGSFLHNLRVPLRGHLMTGLSAALLSAAHRRRPERGALWRAGLVCAALKSVSPSAVLLGPMAAITAEGFLMEAGTALLPGAAGRALGGGLAMAWIPVHLAGRALLLYGFQAAVLFDAVWAELAGKWGLGQGPWVVVGLFGTAHFIAGALFAGLPLPVERPPLSPSGGTLSRPPSFSIAAPRLGHLSEMLWLDLLLLLASLRLLKSSALPGATAWAVGLTGAWAFLYPGAARRLARPGLWVGVLVVGLAAGALLGPDGPQAGLRMALRALVLSAGFAALSQELAGPKVRAWLARWGAGPFLTAVEGAFASLPGVVARLPPAAVMLRHPGSAIAALLDAAEPPGVFVVSSGSGGGKTRFLGELVGRLKAKRIVVQGFRAPGSWKDGVREGFALEVLSTGARMELSRRDGPKEWPRLAGPFHFSEDALAAGRKALAESTDDGVLVVDEVGPLELKGGGWGPELDRLVNRRQGPMVWAARENLVETIQARWGVYAEKIWTPQDDPAAAADALATLVRG